MCTVPLEAVTVEAVVDGLIFEDDVFSAVDSSTVDGVCPLVYRPI